jgi:hypothetical protein
VSLRDPACAGCKTGCDQQLNHGAFHLVLP